MGEQSRPEFKRDVQCTFFANWLDSLEKIIDADNLTSDIDLRATASYRFFRAIMDFSLYDIEPSFQSENPMMQLMLETLWGEIVREIESSLENRANWCKVDYLTKDKRRIIDAIAEMTIAGEAISNRKVSMRVFGVESKHDTVRRVQAKYQTRINARIAEVRSKATQGTVANDDRRVYCDGNGTYEVAPESSDLETDELPF